MTPDPEISALETAPTAGPDGLPGHPAVPATLSLATLPIDLLLATFALLEPADLRQLRLASKELCAWASASVRALRPAAGADLPRRFPALQALDLCGVEEWEEAASACLEPLAHASALTALKLGRRNPLTPEGAAAVAALTGLRSLELLESPLSDAALLRWTSLTALTSLSLRDCARLSDAGLAAAAGALLELQAVELGPCAGGVGVGDATLRVLGSLPALRRVDLTACDGFTPAGLEALAAAGALRTLLLPACWHLGDAALSAVAAAMPRLECLGLFEAGEGVTDAGLLALTRLTRLTALDLGYSCWSHTAGGLAALLRGLPALRMLNLAGAEGVCDATLEAAAQSLTRLTRLDASECQRVTLAGVRHLATLPELVELTLGWNLRLADAALQALAAAPARRLAKLDLSFCGELTDGAVAAAAALPSLESLVLRKCGRVGDGGVAALAARGATLRALDLSYTAVTSRGLRHLAALMALEDLALAGCPRAVTVLGLGSLAACPALSRLDVSDNKRLDNGCMMALSFVAQLRRLALRACPRVTDHGALALLRLGRLRELDVDGCHGVSAMALSALQRRLPLLRRLRHLGTDGVAPRAPSWGGVHPASGRLF